MAHSPTGTPMKALSRRTAPPAEAHPPAVRELIEELLEVGRIPTLQPCGVAGREPAVLSLHLGRSSGADAGLVEAPPHEGFGERQHEPAKAIQEAVGQLSVIAQHSGQIAAGLAKPVRPPQDARALEDHHLSSGHEASQLLPCLRGVASTQPQPKPGFDKQHHPAPDAGQLGVCLKILDLTLQALRHGNVIGVEMSEVTAPGCSHTDVARCRGTLVASVQHLDTSVLAGVAGDDVGRPVR
jgi:hypothetical protein